MVIAAGWLLALVLFVVCAAVVWFVTTPVLALGALLRWAGLLEVA